MNKTDKMSSMPTARQVHCFPELHGGCLCKNEKNDDRCIVFQPLYSSLSKLSDPSNESESNRRAELNPTDTQDSIQQQWYQKGYAAGEQDARKMAQADLLPQIRHFRDSVTALSRDMENIFSTSGTSIAALGEAIAEKILGRPVKVDPSSLLTLQQRLQHALASNYQIELKMNPEDFKVLTTMEQGLELDEDNLQTISFATCCDIERGTVLESENKIPMDGDQIDFIIETST